VQVRREGPANKRIAWIIRRVTDEDSGIDHLKGANGSEAAIGDGDTGIADRAGYSERTKPVLIRGDTIAGDGDRSLKITGNTIALVTLDRDTANRRRVDGGAVAKARGAQPLEPASETDRAAIVKVVGRDGCILVYRTIGRNARAIKQIVNFQSRQNITHGNAGPDNVKIPRVNETHRRRR